MLLELSSCQSKPDLTIKCKQGSAMTGMIFLFLHDGSTKQAKNSPFASIVFGFFVQTSPPLNILTDTTTLSNR